MLIKLKTNCPYFVYLFCLVLSDAKRDQNPLTNLIKALIVVASVLSLCAAILIFVVIRNRKIGMSWSFKSNYNINYISLLLGISYLTES